MKALLKQKLVKFDKKNVVLLVYKSFFVFSIQ